MNEFKVVCVNDRNKPHNVPQSSWIEKGEVYTVVEVASMAKQRMITGYKLAEVSLPADSEYKYYLSNRFRLYDQDDQEAESAVEELIEETLELVEI